ncbi:hypothetical protein ACLOJK_031799 [Asimina triloba]
MIQPPIPAALVDVLSDIMGLVFAAGVFYLYMKTIERAHMPNKLWERVKLPRNYEKALEIIDKHMMYWPKFLIHKVKQRLTKMTQYRIRMRKLELKVREKIMTMPRKEKKREARREEKAEKAAILDKSIEKELLERLKTGVYGDIYNYPVKEYNKVLKMEGLQADTEEEDEEEPEIEYVEGYEELEEEEDMEDFGGFKMDHSLKDGGLGGVDEDEEEVGAADQAKAKRKSSRVGKFDGEDLNAKLKKKTKVIVEVKDKHYSEFHIQPGSVKFLPIVFTVRAQCTSSAIEDNCTCNEVRMLLKESSCFLMLGGGGPPVHGLLPCYRKINTGAATASTCLAVITAFSEVSVLEGKAERKKLACLLSLSVPLVKKGISDLVPLSPEYLLSPQRICAVQPDPAQPNFAWIFSHLESSPDFQSALRHLDAHAALQIHRFRSAAMAQESQKREADGPGIHPSDVPILCSNNCGFFGSAATRNLCSKCYRDLFLQKSKLEFDEGPAAGLQPVKIEGGDQAEPAGGVDGPAEKELLPPPNRCGMCRKRVGLTGFKCRCGQTFCSLHRYSDKHGCSFDYKGAGQDAISKANPVVKAEKIEKI